MLRLSLAAIGLVVTSATVWGQTPPQGGAVPPLPAATANPISPVPPIVPVRARNAKRAVSPGFAQGTPIIDGNPHIRINRVGQVLTDELP